MSLKAPAFLASTLLFALTFASPAFAAGKAEAPAARTLVADSRTAEAPAGSAVTAVNDDASRYEQREAKAKKQAEYKGGDYLVIGISTGAAIVILIIVLLLI